MITMHEDMEICVHCGVHGRVAVKLAEIADAHNISLYMKSGEQKVDCKSILEVLSLALIQGSLVRVYAEGEQAEYALDAVRKILTRRDAL